MKVTINLDPLVVERLFQDYCNERECHSCPCQIIVGDKFDSCKEKYNELVLKVDAQDIINEALSSI